MPRTISRTVDAEIDRIIISLDPPEVLVEWSEEERGQSGALIRRDGQPLERVDGSLTPAQRLDARQLVQAVRAILRARYSGTADS